MAKLSPEFTMTDLGDLHHFLGITVTRPHMAYFYPSDSMWTFLRWHG
jgi:hypothetical protein